MSTRDPQAAETLDATSEPARPPRMAYRVDERGCHIWQRARNSRGYGVVWFDGKVRLAHRVAWFVEHGEWPTDGLMLDHICNTKPCVNPAHLRELPNYANLRRAIPRGDQDTEARRLRWRAANARRRSYSPDYVLGGE